MVDELPERLFDFVHGLDARVAQNSGESRADSGPSQTQAIRARRIALLGMFACLPTVIPQGGQNAVNWIRPLTLHPASHHHPAADGVIYAN